MPSPTGTSSPPAAAPVSDGPFTLLFRDDFETLDSTRWQLMTHSWGGNLALFSSQSATVENDNLVLRLLPAPEGTVDGGETKQFLGAEVRSRQTLTYGRVRARAKFARGSAVVSALVTIYTPWPADNWNELDIEALGADPSEVQFNTQVYQGPAVEPPVTTPVSPTQAPHMETLGFDASADFHEYTIEWTPESATFWIDSELRYTWSEEIGLMTLPQNVLMTIWASDSPTWAGSVTEQTAGATAVYDWVELWAYDASATPAATVPGEITQPVAEQPVMAAPTEPSGQAADSDDTDADSAGTAADATTPEAEGGDIPVSEPQASDSGEGDNPADGMPMPEPPMSIPSEAGEDEADTTGANESPPGEDAPFELLFRDDFDEFDGARWQLMTHSWDTNLALFAAEAAVVRDGVMELTLLEAPSGATDDTGASKSFLGAEVRSYDTIEYGRVRARMRLAKGSAVISALVTIYTPWPADDWNELDIEALGADTSRVQFNSMVYTGAPLEVPATTSVSPTQYPELVDLGFDSSAEYHVYTIEWTPEAVSFLVDDVLMHGWSERIDLMGLPQNVLLTIWASSSASWAGPVTSETAGARASYDWVEVYEYVP